MTEQVKMFCHTEEFKAEKEINEWLKKMGSKIKVIARLQSATAVGTPVEGFVRRIHTTIFYEKKIPKKTGT